MIFNFIRKALRGGFLGKTWIKYLIWRQRRKNRKLNLFKQRVVKKYAEKNHINVLIETGTYLGDMIYAIKNDFKKIYSIELDEALYKKAIERFKREKHVSIFHGDSGMLLPKFLKKIKEPCLFWLDGHYSGDITAKGVFETPIRQEIEAILNHQIKKHIILIDDARLFVGKNDYPTIEELRDLIKKDSNYILDVKNDIIRINLAKKQMAKK